MFKHTQTHTFVHIYVFIQNSFLYYMSIFLFYVFIYVYVFSPLPVSGVVSVGMAVLFAAGQTRLDKQRCELQEISLDVP